MQRPNFSSENCGPLLSHAKLDFRARLKRDGTRAETIFRLSAKRGIQFSRLLAA